MRNCFLVAAVIGYCSSAFGQAGAPTTCDSTTVLSVENFASGNASNALGGISKILWCDFEFPAPTTPVTSVLVHGQPAFITLQTVQQTTPVTSAIFHGYPSFVPQEIVVQLPNVGVPTGPNQLQLLRGPQTLTSTSIPVDQFAPGIFTLDLTPGGPAAAWDTSMNYILPSNPAHTGEAVTIFCEGLGPTTPFVPTGSIPDGIAITSTTPEVHLGNQLAVVILSKLATGVANPSAAGVYEVTFIVPPVPGATVNQPIYLTIGGATSNTATLPIMP